jgi:hypothetical protein
MEFFNEKIQSRRRRCHWLLALYDSAHLTIQASDAGAFIDETRQDKIRPRPRPRPSHYLILHLSYLIRVHTMCHYLILQVKVPNYYHTYYTSYMYLPITSIMHTLCYM